MGASVEEIMQVFSNLAGATAGTPTTQNRAAASNKATQNSLAAKYQRDMEEQRKKQEKAGIFGKLGGAIGGTVGTLVGGPVGGVIGSTLGGGAGTAVGGGNNPMEVAAGNAVSGLAGMGASKLGGVMPQLAPMDTNGQLTTGNVDPNQIAGNLPPSQGGMTPPVQVSPLPAPDGTGLPITKQHVNKTWEGYSGNPGLADTEFTADGRPDIQLRNDITYDPKTGQVLPTPFQGRGVPGLDPDQFTLSKPLYAQPLTMDIPAQFQDYMQLQGFANGGLVTDNQPKIVGEQGPEVVVPGAGSMILPNLALRGLANYIDPTTGIMGQPNPNPVQQSMQGGNPHAVARTMEQSVENTGVGTRFQNAAGMPGDPQQLTPEAQKKQQIADTMRNFGARGGLNNIIGAARQFSDMGGFENFSVAPRVDAARIPVGLDTERAIAVKGAFDTADKQAMDERRMKLEERGAKVAENQGQQRIDTDKQRVNLEGQAMEQRAAEGEKNRELEERLSRMKELGADNRQATELAQQITLQGMRGDIDLQVAKMSSGDRQEAAAMLNADRANQLTMEMLKETNRQKAEVKQGLWKFTDDLRMTLKGGFNPLTGVYEPPSPEGATAVLNSIKAYIAQNPDLNTPENQQYVAAQEKLISPTVPKQAPGATTTVAPLDASSFFSK